MVQAITAPVPVISPGKERRPVLRVVQPPTEQAEPSILDFHSDNAPDIFHKCCRFDAWIEQLKRAQLYQGLYRVTLTSGLGNRIRVLDPFTGDEREKICFDSNSYLQLHRHPRVLEAVRRTLDLVGYGTASAQLLGGTNTYLKELEQAVCRFHGREAALIFSSGYAANLGAIQGLVRRGDLVVRDRFSHASIHDACRASESRTRAAYGHLDCDQLEQILHGAEGTCAGKLIISDGVFSMHGDVAPLPRLVELARRHGARLMIDEAHATGIIGATGRGIEEHYGLPGSVDLLMGTFSKAPGTVGGYVTGSKEVISYLRFFARTAMFTATLPAPLCAGIAEAYRVMEQEPEHRLMLWDNIRAVATGLRQVGWEVQEPQSPILPLFLGSQRLMMAFSRDLFQQGVKAGNVGFPAVPRKESILRLSVNAHHTPEDIEQTVSILERLGRSYDILGRTRAEIQAIGERLGEQS